jgi:hypothetical protein
MKITQIMPKIATKWSKIAHLTCKITIKGSKSIQLSCNIASLAIRIMFVKMRKREAEFQIFFF